MYSGPKLIELLAQKHRETQNSELFKQGTFTLNWRTKVGSFPHPDLETLVSAGEPCGPWKPYQGRPEDKRKLDQNLQHLPTVPLNGYIPGSAIRGLVRAWAKKRPDIKARMEQLLGKQDDTNNTINAGKIQFLDAWPTKPTRLTLDIVNPQYKFQVLHTDKLKPLSLYTLGNGQESIKITVAIRGIPNNTTPEEVQEVWVWVEQALSLYGVGGRTASGYGSFKRSENIELTLDPNYAVKELDFTLYTQGCAGPDPKQIELRPSHWRGWLRSWVWRFLLGVMSLENAEKTLNKLFGTIEPKSIQGCVRLRMTKGKIWGKSSNNNGALNFYTWKGKLEISAPEDILNSIILPIIKFAVIVGGVGRGWRRPLHIFTMKNGNKAARGTHLVVKHTVRNSQTNQDEERPYEFNPLKPELWIKTYDKWLESVKEHWPKHIDLEANRNLNAEVFSPHTCAVYVVPKPEKEPLNIDRSWDITEPLMTRGEGMNLIYKPDYKGKEEVGGKATGGDNSSCSWVSIKRIDIPNQICQEVVCLFLGGQNPDGDGLRSQFLKDLAEIEGSVHLFGVKANSNQEELCQNLS